MRGGVKVSQRAVVGYAMYIARAIFQGGAYGDGGQEGK